MLGDLADGLLGHQHGLFVGNCTFAEGFRVLSLYADNQVGWWLCIHTLTRPGALVAASIIPLPLAQLRLPAPPVTYDWTGQDQYEP